MEATFCRLLLSNVYMKPLLACLPLVFAATTVAAQSTQPPRRAHHALAYDEARQRIVLTAGSTPLNGGQSFDFFNDRWEFDGTKWIEMPASGTRMSGVRLAYDPQSRRMYSFGGYIGGSGSQGDLRVLESDGWRTIGKHPEIVAAEPGFVYDAARRNFIAFGGSGGQRRAHGDTWIFDGTSWTKSDATGPAPRQSHVLVYDEKRRKVVLFGGMGAAGPSELFNDLWEFDGATWTRIDKTGPSPRNGAGGTYDAARGVVLIFGGSAAGRFLGDTWSWDGTEWRKLAETGPEPRVMGEMAFDRRRGRAVLFGGRKGWPDGDLNDTWEWNGARWSRVATAP